MTPAEERYWHQLGRTIAIVIINLSLMIGGLWLVACGLGWRVAFGFLLLAMFVKTKVK